MNVVLDKMWAGRNVMGRNIDEFREKSIGKKLDEILS